MIASVRDHAEEKITKAAEHCHDLKLRPNNAKVPKAGENLKELNLGLKHWLSRVSKYTQTFNFLFERAEKSIVSKLPCLFFSTVQTRMFIASFRPHAYTRFQSLSLPRPQLYNWFAYIIDGI